jgi:hypothetical protein
MELSLGDTDDMIRGWFTSNKFDDMVGPIFHISETGNGECRSTDFGRI